MMSLQITVLFIVTAVRVANLMLCYYLLGKTDCVWRYKWNDIFRICKIFTGHQRIVFHIFSQITYQSEAEKTD
jgi:hypothetical protein